MAYVISDSCVSCGTCESECPVSAISQGDSTLSTLTLASPAVPVQVFARPALSTRVNETQLFKCLFCICGTEEAFFIAITAIR